MNGIWNPGKPGIIFVFLVFCLTWAGSQGVHAALLDGLLDGVEESLAEGLANKGEKLTNGKLLYRRQAECSCASRHDGRSHP